MANTRNWKIDSIDVLKTGPVVPVIGINEIEQAVPLAKALLAGGIKVLEVLLRSDVAVDAIHKISQEVPEAIVGAGTVVSPEDLQAVTEAGAVFAFSPGMTEDLLVAANNGSISLIPGISTASELMAGMALGYTEFKFYPAAVAGGVPMLKALGGAFSHIAFCPTGGISSSNYKEYLALANVACVGGSWIVPSDAIQQGDWQRITALARDAVAGS